MNSQLNLNFISGGPSIAPSHAGGSPTHSAGTGEEGGSQAPFQMRIKKRVFRSELMTRQVRATAVITLGKLCLPVCSILFKYFIPFIYLG